MGKPAPSALAVVMMSGATPQCSMANHLPVRPMPVWISSPMSRMPCFSQIFLILPMYSGGGTMKPPSPCTGSAMTAATSSAFTCLAKAVLEQVGAGAAAAGVGHGQRAPVAVRVGDAVDLGRVRPEAHLVRRHLGGEAQGHVGAAVEGVLKGDDGLAARGVAGDLDRVLDGLGARVHEEGALGEVARGMGVELLGQLHVGLVAEQPEAHVRVELGLLLDRRHHLGMAVARRS